MSISCYGCNKGDLDMKKKLISFILVICMIASLSPVITSAESTEVASGTCGDGLNWVLTADGTLAISGEGMMRDFTNPTNEEWHEYWDRIMRVEIKTGVTSIGREAFSGCYSLESVSIPTSVTSIGYSAFSKCASLKSVTIPLGITSIESNTFSGCVLLESVSIPTSVTSIGERAFFVCTSLETVTIPTSVTSIGERAFSGCVSLESASIPTSATRIEDYAFDSCNNLSIAYYYCGTPEQWDAIQMGVGNNYLTTAAREYHFWDNGETTKKPTAVDEGEIIYTCTACGDNKTEKIDKLPEDSKTEEPIENPFTDVVEKDFFFQPVMWAVSNKVTSGLSAESFGPAKGCTRAQVVTFLWRAAGEPAPTSNNNPFTDVKEGQYYYDAVLWAVENGITTGLNATTFGTNADCNRGQIVTFLWRAMGKPAPTSSNNPFTDVPESQYYYDAVLWAVEKGITTGLSATSFGPNATCTRGQIVTFLYRAYQ